MTDINYYKYWFMEYIMDDEGKYAYFSVANTDELCRLDMKDNMIEVIGKFDNDTPENQLFRGGLFLNNKVYFPPRMAKEMAVYDIGSSSIYKINMLEKYVGKGKEKIVSNNQGYLSVKDSKGNGWFIYRNSPFCVRINISDDTFDYITCKETGDESILGTEYILLDDVLYAPVKAKNQILKLDMINEDVSLINIGDEKEWYYSIDTDSNGNIFLLSYKTPGIVSWNPKNNKITNIVSLKMNGIIYESELILRCAEDGFIIFPGLDLFADNDCCLKVDRQTLDVRENELFFPFKGYIKYNIQNSKNESFYFVVPKGDDVFFSNKGRYLRYNWAENKLNEWSLPIPEGETEEGRSEKIREYEINVRYRYCYDNWDIHIEDEYLNLDGFLFGILKNDKR